MKNVTLIEEERNRERNEERNREKEMKKICYVLIAPTYTPRAREEN